MSKAILITSYYRSGTSALSGTLNLAGVDITNTDEQNEHNPRGYFENPVLAKRDLELFERLNRRWHDIRLMPEGWWDRPDVGKDAQFLVNELQGKFSDSPLWGVKHPHLCRLLPLYADAARRVSGEAPGVIHIYRDPWVVAHSQFKKNALSRAHALLLWASYVLDGERYARNLARVTLDYETLVKDTPSALRRIGDTLGIHFPKRSPQDLAEINRFLTPTLRRSKPQGRENTPSDLRWLVEGIFEAAVSDARPQVFDAFRARFRAYGQLIDELAQSSLAVTSLFDPTHSRAAPGPTEPVNNEIEGSRLRPAEHTDSAEKKRLVAELAALDNPPSLGVVVAVPEGRVEAAFDTAKSIDEQWWSQPAEVRYLCADPSTPDREHWQEVGQAPGKLTEAVADCLNRMETDYAAVIDAGDLIEPDAVARMTLYAEQQKRPALIYTDEIVKNYKSPWIRHKPAFDIQRLRSLHYLGGWLWVNTRWLREQTPLCGELAGAEDYDLALRTWEAGGTILRLPEALYARVPDSRRDAVHVDTVRANSQQALESHIERCKFQSSVNILGSEIPGLYHIRHQPLPDKFISLVLLCNEADASHVADLAPERLQQLTEALALDHVVVAAARQRTHHALLNAMDILAEHNPMPGRVHTVIQDTEAAMLKGVADAVGQDAVIMLSIDADTDDAGWLGHLQGKLFGQNQRVGAVGAAAQYTADDGAQRLLGPLLLGGNEGVSVIAAARDANDTGPGGWLLNSQSVDGLAPPCLVVRGDLLKAVDIDEHMAGAALWLDLSQKIRQQGYDIVWDPTVRVTYPHVPYYLTQSDMSDVEASRRLRARWGCASRHHHPGLALQGENLSPLAHGGMVAPTPRPRIHALLSGNVEGAEYAVEWLREVRNTRSMSATWAPEPLSITETLRLAPDVWLRVNPDAPVNTPDAPSWQALFTKPTEADAQTLKAIGKGACRILTTSPVLAQALKKRSYNRIVPKVVTPRLPGRVWKAFKSQVGRQRVRILWIDEGERPDWITDLLAIQGVDWHVVETGATAYDGPIATYTRPNDENGWFSLFSEVSPNAVIRPAHRATWMDCQPLLRGAAAGAALFADPRLDWPDALPVTGIDAKFDGWRRTVERIKSDMEALAEQGRQAREAVERIGWIEDQDIIGMLMTGSSSVSADRCRVGR